MTAVRWDQRLDDEIAARVALQAQLDATVANLPVKPTVKYATQAALPANTRTGNVLDATANGTLAVDGVNPAVNDRVLVKDETTGANNFIYTVTNAGSGSTKWKLTRATDADTSAEVVSGALVPVSAGSTNAATVWRLNTPDPITLNTTALTFVQDTGPRPPSGAAGGDLSGIYPNPTIGAKKVLLTGLADAIVETGIGTGTAAAGDAAVRKLGTGANDATAGNDARVPTQGENDALVGTSGTPSSSNKFVTDADTRVPTQGENDALVGTSGTPSTSNPFVTKADRDLWQGMTVDTHANRLLATATKGKLWKESDNGGVVYIGDGAAWQLAQPTGRIIKASDESPVNNSTTLVSDSELRIRLENSEKWLLRGVLLVTSASNTSDFRYAFGLLAGAGSFSGSHQISGNQGLLTSASPGTATGIATAQGAGSANGTYFVTFSGVITSVSGMASGVALVALQWAQNTATVEDTILKAGSVLEFTRVA